MDRYSSLRLDQIGNRPASRTFVPVAAAVRRRNPQVRPVSWAGLDYRVGYKPSRIPPSANPCYHALLIRGRAEYNAEPRERLRLHGRSPWNLVLPLIATR